MSKAPRILAFAGSTRKESYNKKLVQIAAASATKAGADVEFIDLKNFPLPLFDEDLEKESGLPANVLALKKLVIAADGFLIASPEYNSSITAVLKNTIDWLTRPAPGETPLAAFMGKSAALMAASPGGLGGLRGLVHIRAILGNIGVLVLPDQVAVAKAYEAFNPDGSLKDPKQHASIEMLGTQLASVVGKLKG